MSRLVKMAGILALASILLMVAAGPVVQLISRAPLEIKLGVMVFLLSLLAMGLVYLGIRLYRFFLSYTGRQPPGLFVSLPGSLVQNQATSFAVVRGSR